MSGYSLWRLLFWGSFHCLTTLPCQTLAIEPRSNHSATFLPSSDLHPILQVAQRTDWQATASHNPSTGNHCYSEPQKSRPYPDADTGKRIAAAVRISLYGVEKSPTKHLYRQN